MNNALALNKSFLLKGRIFSLKRSFSLVNFFSIGILLIISLSVFYIFQVNIEISEKYLIQKYENELNQLVKVNKSLIVSSVQTNSLENIAGLLENPDQAQDLRFEKIDKIHYIQILDSQLVAK